MVANLRRQGGFATLAGVLPMADGDELTKGPWETSMPQVIAYVSHLASGLALLAAFFFLYIRITSYNELQLIRRGNRAAAWTLGGAVVGFCLTLASSILHNDTLATFVAWAAVGMVVQLAVYVLIAHSLRRFDQAIVDDNEAMGMLLGGLSLAVGILSAACMS